MITFSGISGWPKEVLCINMDKGYCSAGFNAKENNIPRSTFKITIISLGIHTILF